MSENSSQPIQIHLFSEQISEQIGRLRLLTGAESNRSDLVAIKRAVMATRLLAGGARALGLESLPLFLEEFLRWLQAIQRSEKPASPTQELILEAVIEFEEELMRHLETYEEEADLSAFQEQIAELRGLIRHNQERAQTPKILDLDEIVESDERILDLDEIPHETAPPPAAPADLEDAAPSGAAYIPELSTEADEGPVEEDPQDRILDTLRELTDRLMGLDARLAESLGSRQDARKHLIRLHETLNELLQTTPSGEGVGTLETAPPSEPDAPTPQTPTEPSLESTLDESEDPFVQGLAVILEERRDALEGCLDYRVSGSLNCTLRPEVERKLNRVIDHLLEDSCDILDQMLREEDAPPRGRLELHLSEAGDRLRISLRDNGPQLEATPALNHLDPLSLYRGLRRSRGLIQELHGIILVEPADQPGTRFVLSLPQDPQHPVVKLMDLGTVQAALPGLLIDEYLSTDGLLFHRDTDGEHFIRNGHPVPLVDLAQYASDVKPIAEEASGIVIVGSVEKRLGIYCYGLSESMTLDSNTETLDGWDEVSTKVVELEGKHLPLLSITRLLRLRMAMPEVAEPGSVHDPVLDMYPDFQESAPVKLHHEAPAPPTRRVLLVNHSEFRRRELARILELRGYHVTATCDISSGLSALENQRVAFVVSDLRLGREDSAGFADLRRAFASTPVILSTSVERQHAEELVERTGADACWLEPYHWAALHSLLQALGVSGPGPQGGDFAAPAS
jgi:CheY-like chemotaxis protein